jgi:lipopolysaccharide assembly outer membrane protein LptD (OstA)
VAYNLFTLQADRVDYDVQNRTLEATGNVATVSPNGVTQHADSLTFKFANGEASRLP